MMKLVYEMRYTHPTEEKPSIEMLPYSSGLQEAYMEMYND